MEESVSGFKVRGTWGDVVEHGERVTRALRDAGVGGEAFEEWDEWRPKSHERLGEDVSKKTAAQASVAEGEGEKAGKDPDEDLQTAGERLSESYEHVEEGDSDGAVERWSESLGYVAEAGPDSDFAVGDCVFVPGARCFGEVRGLFGGAASRVVVPESRLTKLDPRLGANGVLMALAATAYHALAAEDAALPDLIVGHGVLGRLLARLTLALGGPSPTVWETDPVRQDARDGYPVLAPENDERRDYRAIYDVSGRADLLDDLIGRLAYGGGIVLAGFYSDRPSFNFPQAFIREARIRIAAEWRDADLHAVTRMAERGAFSLDGLITHRRAATDADSAYRTAFGDSACLKMILDWRGEQ